MATTKQVSKRKAPNPTGKGGFQERPQDRNSGYWDSSNTISFQYKRFLKMTPAQMKEFEASPEDQKTVAMVIAHAQVVAAKRSLNHAKEVTDRTEGKASQAIDITSGGEAVKTALVEFVSVPVQSNQLKRHKAPREQAGKQSTHKDTH